MADIDKKSSGRYYEIGEGGYVYPLDPNVKRKITHGKWGTPMPGRFAYVAIKPASRKKR